MPPQMREPTSYGFCRVGPRCDFFNAFHNDIDGRFKEFSRLVPGGEGAITSDLGCMERHGSPLYAELPTLHVVTCVLVPR